MKGILLPLLLISLYSCALAVNFTEADSEESVWTTYEPDSNSRIIYVSSSVGDDTNDGLSEETAVETLTRGAALVRDGEYDFLLLRRGDTWRGEDLYRFKSGRDADHPMVIASYGTSMEMPRIELATYFINHNGAERNYLAIMDLEFISYPKIPTDPEFDGSNGGGLRFVGGGTGILVEGCRFTYSELQVQSYGDYHYDGVSIRRNVIEKNYHINTANQNSAYRPSGIYASHVQNLLIEENLFDHNGWNEDVDTADASMYNHNMYLNGCDDLVVQRNIITRSSSMGIKLRSDETSDSQGITIKDNIFADGEIGLSVGGNTSEEIRFEDVLVQGNVFSQIGLSNASGRNFAWFLDIQDNARTTVLGNYFLHQPWYTNSFGIKLQSGSQEDINILNNTFYDIREQSLSIAFGSSWSNLSVSGNTFVDPEFGSSLVYVRDGSLDGISFSNNRYYSTVGDTISTTLNTGLGDDYATSHTYEDWQTISNEAYGEYANPDYYDPNRTLGSYAGYLGLESDIPSFVEEARLQNRMNWREEYTASAVKEYITKGFSE